MTKLLLVEDNGTDAVWFKNVLRDVELRFFDKPEFEINHVEIMRDAVTEMRQHDFDIIFLDLNLPDSKGEDTLFQVSDFFHQYPVVILTGFSDEEFALETVKNGVQDYIMKEDLNVNTLYRTIRYSVERFSILMEKERLIHKLEDSLVRIKKLEKMVPICSSCKKNPEQ